MLGIDLRNSRELRATFLAMRNADKELQKQLRAGVKSFTAPEWSGAVLQQTRTTRQTRVLGQTSKVAASNQNIRLSAGNSAKKLSGGGKARDLAHAEEFGANRDKVATVNSRRGGTSYRSTRHTTRQFGPPRRKGYVVYQAAAEVIPRIASMAVQTVVRTLLDAVEGKQ